MKSFHCFCIGYSAGFSLEELNKVATIANGKTYRFFDDARIDYVSQADRNNVVQEICMLGRIFELESDGLKRKQTVLKEQIAYVEKE